MDWQYLLKTLGGTSIVIAAIAWLSRKLIQYYLAKDLENYKSNLKAQNQIAIEQLRAALQVEAQRRSVEFESLHEKRVATIADLYAHLFDMQSLIQRLYFEYQGREIKEDIDRKLFRKNRKEWELEPGIDTLSESEEETVRRLSEETTKFYEFYKKNRIYFSLNVCGYLDRFATLAAYLSSSYHNVALKDKDGNLMVNPKVKEVWDKALENIPQLLNILESEFRNILGVK